MTYESWMTWSKNQIADVGLCLLRQGYAPSQLSFLLENNTFFSDRYEVCMGKMMASIDAMQRNPDGYHHFEEFTNAKSELLDFTSEHREAFLLMDLAQTA